MNTVLIMFVITIASSNPWNGGSLETLLCWNAMYYLVKRQL